MSDLTTEQHYEVLALRDAQETAEPTQMLDSARLLKLEVERVRDLDIVSQFQDTNTELARAWDGVR